LNFFFCTKITLIINTIANAGGLIPIEFHPTREIEPMPDFKIYIGADLPQSD